MSENGDKTDRGEPAGRRLLVLAQEAARARDAAGSALSSRAVAHGHRLASKRRVVPLLHRRIEGVHVHMDDLANRATHGSSVPALERKVNCRGL